MLIDPLPLEAFSCFKMLLKAEKGSKSEISAKTSLLVSTFLLQSII